MMSENIEYIQRFDFYYCKCCGGMFYYEPRYDDPNNFSFVVATCDNGADGNKVEPCVYYDEGKGCSKGEKKCDKLMQPDARNQRFIVHGFLFSEIIIRLREVGYVFFPYHRDMETVVSWMAGLFDIEVYVDEANFNTWLVLSNEERKSIEWKEKTNMKEYKKIIESRVENGERKRVWL